MDPKHHLPLNLQTFGFVEREKKEGIKVPNQCGRDFLYYCLTYYFPERFSPTAINPEMISKNRMFGMAPPTWLIWTGWSFMNVPKTLRSMSLKLVINEREIDNYFDFIFAMQALRYQSYEKSMKDVESAIDDGTAVGIDVGMKYFGLMDHVMFVYGYDEENLYVFDTHQIKDLEYEKITPSSDNRFIMKLPKSIIKKRWTIFNKVWEVKHIK